MSEIPLETLLEATMFSAGKSLSPSEFSEVLGYEEEEVIELDIPEEVAFNDAPMEEIGANSDFSVEMARSEAPVIAEVSDIPEPVDFEQHEMGEIYVNETIDIASGLELNELSAVRGHTGESATGASGAVDTRRRTASEQYE